MNFDKEPEIEIWDVRKPIELSKIVIEITEPKNQLPDDYKRMVDEKWQEFLKFNPKAFDGVAFYLQSYESQPDGSIRGLAERRVFSINQAFSRGKGLPNGRNVANKVGVSSIFTNTLYVLTKDEKDGEWCVLYGENARYDPNNKLADNYLTHSIAGGIANLKDLTEDGKRLDFDKFFRRKVKDETGNEEYLRYITGMYATGLVFRDVLPNRGFDLVGVVETSLETGKALELFNSNPNFKKKPIAVRLTVDDLCSFLSGSRLDTFCWTSIAASYMVLQALKGNEAASKVLEHIETNWKSYIKVLDPLLAERKGGKVYDILGSRNYSS